MGNNIQSFSLLDLPLTKRRYPQLKFKDTQQFANMSNLPSEPEFEQAYKELASTLENSTLFQQKPEYKTALKVVSVPERVIQFRVVWEDDKGGADFDPKGKSDNEIRRFCVSFMRELSKHIGADTDVPAGDIGVGGREIGYLFGAYKAEKNKWEGILTGKGGSWGGSLIRPEATGFGLVYYVGHMIAYAGQGSFKGKTVAISGSGNVAQYAALKAIELGATVVSLSDSKGSLIAAEGESFAPEDISKIAELKLKRQSLTEFSTSKYKYIDGARPWTHVKVDVALPCATQNEVSKEEAEALVASGARFIAEGSNMGCTQDAIDVFEAERKSKGDKAIWYAPGKAANAGGVAVSGLEMAQNSARISWTSEEVDEKLKGIMEAAFKNGLETAKKYVEAKDGEFPSLVAGSNIAGFVKVAAAMHDQGDWW